VADQIGYGQGLSTALARYFSFEPGESLWSTGMASTHPPVELRLEALSPEAKQAGPPWAHPHRDPSAVTMFLQRQATRLR